MKDLTIAMIRDVLSCKNVDEKVLLGLKKDQRKGVQNLVRSYEKKQQQKNDLLKKFVEMCHYENKGYTSGKNYIAGVDEAGRGPLAGPVVAAAVILPKDFILPGLTDSKKVNKQTRNEFYDVIIEQAISYAVAMVDSQVIDDMNIYEATKRVMIESIGQLDQKPDHVLIDAVKLHQLDISSESIIKGDERSVTIAAASILAKVTRDRLMSEIHEEYPLYDFQSNMGYGTKHHINMLEIHGITPYHRKTFGPVKNAMNQ